MNHLSIHLYNKLYFFPVYNQRPRARDRQSGLGVAVRMCKHFLHFATFLRRAHKSGVARLSIWSCAIDRHRAPRGVEVTGGAFSKCSAPGWVCASCGSVFCATAHHGKWLRMPFANAAVAPLSCANASILISC